MSATLARRVCSASAPPLRRLTPVCTVRDPHILNIYLFNALLYCGDCMLEVVSPTDEGWEEAPGGLGGTYAGNPLSCAARDMAYLLQRSQRLREIIQARRCRANRQAASKTRPGFRSASLGRTQRPKRSASSGCR